MKSNNQKTIPAILTGILFILAMAGSTEAAIGADDCNFTTVYVVNSANYSLGGDTITLSVVASDVQETPADIGSGSNVTVEVYDTTPSVYATLYLINQTLGNGTWTGTWSVPDVNWASNSYIKVNVSDATGHEVCNISNFRIDADNPVIGTPSEVTQTWDTRTGNSKTITSTITDNVAVSYATLDFTSVPSGSSLTDTTMTSCAGGTSVTCTYTFTPDIKGPYTYRIVAYDNVTNTLAGTSYTITFKLPDSSLPPSLIQRKPMPTSDSQPPPQMPAFTVIGESFTGIGGAVVDVISQALNGIASMFASLLGL